MPKPTAIKLSWKTAPLIADHLDIPQRIVEEELEEQHSRVHFYYVTNYVFRGMTLMPYAILMESTFLKEFASVPPGIEDRFVPVTQVKEP